MEKSGSNKLRIQYGEKPIKRIIPVYPKADVSKTEQLRHCLDEIKQQGKYLQPGDRIAKITIFANSSDNQEYSALVKEFPGLINERFNSACPAVVLIPLKPAEGKDIIMELTVITSAAGKFSFKSGSGPDESWCIVDFGDSVEIYGAVSALATENSNTYDCSNLCFDRTDRIMKENGYGFGSIIRQWGYIGRITDYSEMNNNEVENYQMFNISRSEFYKNDPWADGYPSATGIGADIPGIFLEFTAARYEPGSLIIPLRNPGQKNAYHYSDKHLKAPETLKEKRSAPKFERGKIVVTNDFMDIHISGTAAITGEDSHPGDAARQSIITLENISRLITPENLEAHGLNLDGDLPPFTYARVYVKYKKDLETVKKHCTQYFGDIPILFIEADVCREELLVEIEAYLHCRVE